MLNIVFYHETIMLVTIARNKGSKITKGLRKGLAQSRNPFLSVLFEGISETDLQATGDVDDRGGQMGKKNTIQKELAERC
jgi:hypothetical protein